MSVEPPPIPQDMLISATRYALGRGTYIVSDTVEVLITQAQWLTPRVRSVLLRDIGRELDDERRMPDDHRALWKRAYTVLLTMPSREPQDYSTFYRLIGAQPAKSAEEAKAADELAAVSRDLGLYDQTDGPQP